MKELSLEERIKLMDIIMECAEKASCNKVIEFFKQRSQLQALKKKVEERKKGLKVTYDQPNTSENIKPDYYCSIKELEKVLNLITNLEDNG